MVFAWSSNARSPSPGSWLANWLDRTRPHPDVFQCGMRTIEGALPGRGGRWRYEKSFVDPMRDGRIVTLRHGAQAAFRLELDADPYFAGEGPAARSGMTVLSASVVGAPARVAIAVPHGELVRFGIDTL